ncbi:MAG: hypothetical protein R6X19_09000 [Kiritimatiellia bacterium]
MEKATRKTSWTPATDLPEGFYEVRVVGYNGAAYGKWSLPIQFRRVFSPYVASVNGLRHDGGNIELVAGSGITIDADVTNLAVVIRATGTGATTATSGNTANAIVARDTSGSFAAGTITAASFSGSGASLTGINAAQLASGTVPDARLPGNLARSNQVWLLGGNAGTTPGTHYLGTSDNHPLEIKVNGLRAVRLEDNGDSADSGTVRDGAPNIILGSPANWIETGAVGSAIGGGLGNSIQSGSDNATLGAAF